MKICDINPHIRYAEQNLYKSAPVRTQVRDCRIFYVQLGSADIVIENQHYKLTENSLFYCCGGSCYTIGSDDGASLLILNFDLSQKRNTINTPFLPVPFSQNTSLENIDIIENHSLFNGHFFIQDGTSFQYTIKRIIKEFSSKRIYFAEKCSAILKDLLIDIYRKQPEYSDNSYDAVSKIISYIKSNFNAKINNKTLADIAGYHEYHLNRLFVKHTGISLHKYILMIRLDEAKRLLLNTNLSLNLIAEATGFGSNTHFSGYFKQIYNLSPSEYRTKFKNKI